MIIGNPVPSLLLSAEGGEKTHWLGEQGRRSAVLQDTTLT